MRLRFVLPALLVSSVALAVVQERVKKEKPDFTALHASVLRRWNDGQYGGCMSDLRQMTTLVSYKRIESILAALPDAPEGFEIGRQTEVADLEKASAVSAGLGGLAGMVGNVVERNYRGDGATIQVNVTADSPMSQMFSMWIANPKMVGPEAEAVRYGPHNAILKKDGSRWEIQVLVHDKHVVQVQVTGKDDDFLLGFLDQAAIDALARVLGAE